MHGTYETVGGSAALRFERRLAHPIDAVWSAITEPAELARWFPTTVAVELRAGAPMTFTFPERELPPMSGRVTELEPPCRFAFFWGEDPLLFELDPVAGGAGCVLRFTVLLDARDKAARDAAGWHVCLDVLEQSLADAATSPRLGPTSEWRAHYEDYAERGLPTGAPVPGS